MRAEHLLQLYSADADEILWSLPPREREIIQTEWKTNCRRKEGRKEEGPFNYTPHESFFTAPNANKEREREKELTAQFVH